jgi:hypothetical protein
MCVKVDTFIYMRICLLQFYLVLGHLQTSEMTVP